MSRRICLPVLVASFALGAPAASLAQSSSQAQYQGVAPDTQIANGAGNGGGTSGGTGSASGTNASGNGGATNGAGTSSSSSGSSGASGNGGSTGTAAGSGGAGSGSVSASPAASSDTTPFSGGDIALILLACAGLIGLGVVLRRTTRREPAGV
jgi:cobalamin biosynthesis Mg chelatase CobN